MKRRIGTACFVIAMALATTSCEKTSSQDVSRSTDVKEIIVSSIENENSSVSIDDTTVSVSDSAETYSTTWGGGELNKPTEFDFDLAYSEDMLVVDYGKTTVSVYRAKYTQMPDYWNDDWSLGGIGVIWQWGSGWPIASLNDNENGILRYSVQDRETSLENLHSVQCILLKDIDDGSEIAERIGVATDSRILCWTYQIKDFPWSFYEQEDYFKVSDGLQSIQYARLCTQYIDDIPVYGKGSLQYCDTYEWTGVMEPSRLADTGYEILHINPSETCILDFERSRYSVSDTVMKDVPVIDPMSCLNEIKNALRYNPLVDQRISADPSQEDFYHIWEKDVEVYCMELTYAAFDPCPRDFEETEEDHQLHNLTLVPVWEVYYSITNPENDTSVSYGMVMINAVTGESLYSNEYGPNTNTELYPDLLWS
ncbi:MAG: hypothetical protein IK020_12230 [Clostridiales bacterium]|nr:hypothetical protein [Clostridiales bacterium]